VALFIVSGRDDVRLVLDVSPRGVRMSRVVGHRLDAGTRESIVQIINTTVLAVRDGVELDEWLPIAPAPPSREHEPPDVDPAPAEASSAPHAEVLQFLAAAEWAFSLRGRGTLAHGPAVFAGARVERGGLVWGVGVRLMGTLPYVADDLFVLELGHLDAGVEGQLGVRLLSELSLLASLGVGAEASWYGFDSHDVPETDVRGARVLPVLWSRLGIEIWLVPELAIAASLGASAVLADVLYTLDFDGFPLPVHEPWPVQPFGSLGVSVRGP
jgi:hypothetical protein